MREVFQEWAEGDDSELFKAVEWWKNLLETECGNSCEIEVCEADRAKFEDNSPEVL